MLLTACDNKPEHIYDDHSADLVGTWTCLTENYAEALIINADGTAVSYGVENGEYWENVHGTVVTEGGNITMNFEDDDNLTGHFDIIPGKSFSLYEDSGERYIYQYCANDLADEIIGMWVCNDAPNNAENDIAIVSFEEDGTSTLTGIVPNGNGYMVTANSTYKVVGDLQFQKRADAENAQYIVNRIIYSPNATTSGDIMTKKSYITTEKGKVETIASWLRIKQHLELPGNKYDYRATYVTNAKGEDKDIPFLNTSFNFAKMDGSIIDKFLKSILFTVEFPEANKIKYSYLLEGQNVVIEVPIEVEGNKMTIKMSANNPAYQDVDMYAFQDQDNTQMHWYMYTTSFEKFFGNTSVALMLGYGQLDKDDTEGIANVYKTIADAVESINLSLVMSKAK